jgi:hypothetical protein
MVGLMKLVVPEAVERQLLVLSVLLGGENSDEIFSFLDVNCVGLNEYCSAVWARGCAYRIIRYSGPTSR